MGREMLLREDGHDDDYMVAGAPFTTAFCYLLQQYGTLWSVEYFKILLILQNIIIIFLLFFI